MHVYEYDRFVVTNARIIIICTIVYYYACQVYVHESMKIYLKDDDLIGVLVWVTLHQKRILVAFVFLLEELVIATSIFTNIWLNIIGSNVAKDFSDIYVGCKVKILIIGAKSN